MLKKGTIREVISKIIYDPNIDPSEYSVIFRDSNLLRRVPFTYLEFVEDGFYYFGNFYPLYKIMAIIDDATNKYLLKRDILGQKIVGDKGIEIPDYPINLRAIYDDFLLHRYASHILFSLKSRLIEKNYLEWLGILGNYEELDRNDYKAYIINEPGPFMGVTLLVYSDSTKVLIRSIPTPIEIDEIREKVKHHKITIMQLNGDLEHIFAIDNECICIKNIKGLLRCTNIQKDIISKVSSKLSLFLEVNNGESLVAVCDQREFIFKKFREELRITKEIGINSAKIIKSDVRLRDVLIPRGSLIKIHDRDIIFATKKR